MCAAFHGRACLAGRLAVAALLGLAASVRAGSLDDPAGPADPASAMFTFQDLYERLATGAAGAKRAGPFAEPTAGPAATPGSLNEIMARAPTTNAGAASAEEVVGGKAYWGLKTNDWGGKAGAMPLRTFSAATNAMPAGYYGMTDLTEADPDLALNNIRAGVSIFGVAGLPEVADTSSGDAAADMIVEGKKAWVAGAEVSGNVPPGTSVTGTPGAQVVAIPDGLYGDANTVTAADTNLVAKHIVAGVTLFGVAGTLNTNSYARPAKTGQARKADYDDGWWSTNGVGFAWPSPRFTVPVDNTNVVLDNLTGLMWARNANLFTASKDWATAVMDCYELDLGGYYNWRLPNVRELNSLVNYGANNPTLPSGHPFFNVQTFYWSSTTSVADTNQAFGVYFKVINEYDSLDSTEMKIYTANVWPVCGGQ